MNVAPMTAAARTLAVLCLAAVGAHAQDTRDPAISRYGVERVDLRRPDILPAGATTTIGAPESRTTLVAQTDTAVSALMPRGVLNTPADQRAAGLQFVIGAMPDWLARQHGLTPAGSTPEPAPPTLLDRSLDAQVFADRVRVATAIEPRRLRDDAPAAINDRRLPPAFAVGRDLSVSALLQRARLAEQAAASPR